MYVEDELISSRVVRVSDGLIVLAQRNDLSSLPAPEQ